MNAAAPDARSYLWPSLVVALCLHGVFAAWIQPRVSQLPLQRPALPDLGFMEQSSGEARALYSPVLFALPTPMGFSASLLNQPLQSDPPVKEGAAVLNLLPMGQRITESLSGPVFPEGRYQIQNALNLLPTGSVYVEELSTVSNKVSGLSIWYEGAPAFRERAPLEVADIPEAGPEPWLAECYVELEKDSRVRRVLVEAGPEPGPGREALARWLYQQPFQPGHPIAGRVYVQWTPVRDEVSP